MGRKTALLDLAVLARLRSQPISEAGDPWDPYFTRPFADQPLLTSIEVTVTNLCNLRCEHCAVGDLLTGSEPDPLPPDRIIERLDSLDDLLTFSLTGGEPTSSKRRIEQFVLPLLRYAKSRGLRTQINTNLTYDLDRYLAIAEYVDIFHISYNYTGPGDFLRIAYAHAGRAAPPAAAAKLFSRMENNAAELAARGCFVSAETIMTHDTLPHLVPIHQRIAALGCRRHEVHPLYPSDFAATMPLPSLEDYARGVQRLLGAKDPRLWILFGTFPFFPCDPRSDRRALARKVRETPGVTARNDPDGRCRLNIDGLTGDVRVTDFAGLGPLGRIQETPLSELWRRWLDHPIAHRLHCHCPEVACLGPNLMVAESYYRDVDFQSRKAVV